MKLKISKKLASHRRNETKKNKFSNSKPSNSVCILICIKVYDVHRHIRHNKCKSGGRGIINRLNYSEAIKMSTLQKPGTLQLVIVFADVKIFSHGQ